MVILYNQLVQRLYVILPIVVILGLVSTIVVYVQFKLSKKIFIRIDKFRVENNILEISTERNGTCITSTFKFHVRVSNEKESIYTFKSYSYLLSAIEKNLPSEARAYIINSLHPTKGSFLIICTNVGSNVTDEEQKKKHLENVYRIKTLIESLEQDIQLIPLLPSDYDLLAIPKALGGVVLPFAMATEIKPPATASFEFEKGDIEIGVTNDNQPVGLSVQDVERHILVLGSTGSGKSNTAAVIGQGAKALGIKVLVLDWHGEYSKMLKDFYILTESTLPRIDPLGAKRIDESADLLGDVLELTEPQRFLLYVVLQRLKSVNEFTLEAFTSVLKEIDDNSHWVRDVKYALLRKVLQLFMDEGRKYFDHSEGHTTESLARWLFMKNSGVVVDLSAIDSETIRRIYALFIILYISEYIKKSNDKILVIVDEAHNYFVDNKNSILDRIIREYRKFGLHLCIVTQSPSSLSEDVLKNANTKIIHSIKSNQDKRIIIESTALSKDLADYIDKMGVGEAICSCPSKKVNVLIRVKKA
ncbi:MAG: ATP-binding protein [Thermoprotei archaeon]